MHKVFCYGFFFAFKSWEVAEFLDEDEWFFAHDCLAALCFVEVAHAVCILVETAGAVYLSVREVTFLLSDICNILWYAACKEEDYS